MASWLAIISLTAPISQSALPLGVRISQQVLQEWVDVGDPSRIRIQKKYAILGCLEESPVANFGSVQLLLLHFILGQEAALLLVANFGGLQLLLLPVIPNAFVVIVHCRTPSSPLRCLTRGN